MKDSSSSDNNLDPNLREKLLKESKNPFAGPRRILWIVLFGSACLGLFIMLSNLLFGDTVGIEDISIQLIAFITFGSLVLFDKSTND